MHGSDVESCGLVAHYALIGGPNTNSQCILDSGATCHMCNKETMFDNLQALFVPLNVTLGDGQNLQAVGRGNVTIYHKARYRSALSTMFFWYLSWCTIFSVLCLPLREEDNHLSGQHVKSEA